MFTLSCCSTVDLTNEQMAARNISYIAMHYQLDGENLRDDMGKSMPMDDFYRKMAAGADTATSQINITEFLEYFSRLLEQGQDVLHVCLSSGISGTYQSAVNAALIARDRYPDRKLYVVDSLGASSGYGLIMETLADKRDAGMDIDALYEWIEQNKLRLHHWFFSTDLTFYVKGGRVSKTAGFFGGMLGICPLLNMDNLGRLIPRAKIRSKKRVIAEIVRRMEENADNGTAYDGKCYICQSYCREDAEAVKAMVEERFPALKGRVCIYSIGPTIGSHTGPGTVALFFWGSERKD